MSIESTVNCIECGELFDRKRSKRRICGPACKKRRTDRQAKKCYASWNPNYIPATAERICVWCEKKFIPEKSGRITCSTECKRMNARLVSDNLISKGTERNE